MRCVLLAAACGCCAVTVAVSGMASSVACRRHLPKTVDIYLLVRHSGQANHRTCDDLRDLE
jgi:hypothetical protein